MTNREVLGTTTISYKYQITIPKKVRQAYQFEMGDLIIFEQEDGKLYIKTGKDV